MDLLNSNVKKTYLKFLAASFGSALITSIYGLVDMAMVGHYHGPDGVAALAVISPIWNVIYSLGLLCGIGGSVLYAQEKGRSQSPKKANKYFCAAVLLAIILSGIAWVILIAFEEPLLRLFGAYDEILPLSKEYIVGVKYCLPIFSFTQVFSAFLRNDSNPGLATKSVVIGGIFNVFGDWFFVFKMDMGIKGAGIATTLCAGVSVLIMATHFLSKKNTLKLCKIEGFFKITGRIIISGFSSFFVDIAMGILTVLFNRIILKYLGADSLAVYGVIVNINIFIQCCAYGVGQAAQPLLSQNYGARKLERIRLTVKYNIVTVIIISVVWVAACMIFPNGFIDIFMTPTESVLAIAPTIIRCYSISFLFLPFNVYSTYYFQSVAKAKISFIVSVTRGFFLSGALIIVLPMIFSGFFAWFAMPITEILVAVFAAVMMRKSLKSEENLGTLRSVD